MDFTATHCARTREAFDFLQWEVAQALKPTRRWRRQSADDLQVARLDQALHTFREQFDLTEAEGCQAAIRLLGHSINRMESLPKWSFLDFALLHRALDSMPAA